MWSVNMHRECVRRTSLNKNGAQRTTQHVKWTPGARLTITVDQSISRGVARLIIARLVARSLRGGCACGACSNLSNVRCVASCLLRQDQVMRDCQHAKQLHCRLHTYKQRLHRCMAQRVDFLSRDLIFTFFPKYLNRSYFNFNIFKQF